MKLIRELCEQVELISEGEGPSKNLYIKGPFLVAEQKNKNGRVYPMGILEAEVARYTKEKVNENCAWGELGHPPGPNINPDRISHRITELNRDGNVFWGKAIIAETKMGKTARGLMECGGRLGISSRGVGSLKANKLGIMEVQNDYKIATAGDIVTDPSGPGCFVQGIMENTEWIFNVAEGTWAERVIEEIKEEIKKTPKKDLQEAQVRAFEKFCNNLVKKNIV